MIREEKFKGDLYSINIGQNGMKHVFVAMLRLLTEAS
jgi:hypothetical protein